MLLIKIVFLKILYYLHIEQFLIKKNKITQNNKIENRKLIIKVEVLGNLASCILKRVRIEAKKSKNQVSIIFINTH